MYPCVPESRISTRETVVVDTCKPEESSDCRRPFLNTRTRRKLACIECRYADQFSVPMYSHPSCCLKPRMSTVAEKQNSIISVNWIRTLIKQWPRIRGKCGGLDTSNCDNQTISASGTDYDSRSFQIVVMKNHYMVIAHRMEESFSLYWDAQIYVRFRNPYMGLRKNLHLDFFTPWEIGFQVILI